VTAFAVLRALLDGAPAESEAKPVETKPIAPISEKALRAGTVLDAEVTAVEERRILVNIGRPAPVAMEAAVLGGGNLADRFREGQRLNVRVLAAPPFLRLRLG
jgi:ribosomal protein S1